MRAKCLVLTVLDIPLQKFKLSSTLLSLFARGRACLSSKNDAMSNWVNCWANFQPYERKAQLLADDFVSTTQDITLGFTWHRVTAIALNYFNSSPSLQFARDSWAIMRVRNLFCCHFGRKYYLHSIMALIVWSQLILCFSFAVLSQTQFGSAQLSEIITLFFNYVWIAR